MSNVFIGPPPCAVELSFNPEPSSKLKAPYIRCEAAKYWYKFGFDVIPVVADTKCPAVAWDLWLAKLSLESIASHWSMNPNRDVGFIVGTDYIVLDADSPESIAALERIEASFGAVPKLVVGTKKGVHHYFKLAVGTIAKSDAHCTEKHPERIDVKTGRAMVVLPPSAGRSIVCVGGCNAN